MARPFFVGDEFDFSNFGASILVSNTDVLSVQGMVVKPIREGNASVFVYNADGNKIESFNIVVVNPSRPADYLPGLGFKIRNLKLVNRLTNSPATMIIIKLGTNTKEYAAYSLIQNGTNAQYEVNEDGLVVVSDWGNASITDGGGYHGPYIDCAFNDPIVGDFEISTYFEFETQPGTRFGRAMICLYDQSSIFASYGLFNTGDGGTIGLYAYKPQLVGLYQDPQGTHNVFNGEIKLKRVGNQYQFYINDVLKGSHTITSYELHRVEIRLERLNLEIPIIKLGDTSINAI